MTTEITEKEVREIIKDVICELKTGMKARAILLLEQLYLKLEKPQNKEDVCP